MGSGQGPGGHPPVLERGDIAQVPPVCCHLPWTSPGATQTRRAVSSAPAVAAQGFSSPSLNTLESWGQSRIRVATGSEEANLAGRRGPSNRRRAGHCARGRGCHGQRRSSRKEGDKEGGLGILPRGLWMGCDTALKTLTPALLSARWLLSHLLSPVTHVLKSRTFQRPKRG